MKEKAKWAEKGWRRNRSRVEANFDDADTNEDGLASAKERRESFARRAKKKYPLAVSASLSPHPARRGPNKAGMVARILLMVVTGKAGSIGSSDGTRKFRRFAVRD